MLLKLYEKNNNPADLQQVIDLLNDGGILIYPTDTMYAIGCHGLKERAIERICRLKDIDPKKNNLSIICYDLSKVSEYAKVDNSNGNPNYDMQVYQYISTVQVIQGTEIGGITISRPA